MNASFNARRGYAAASRPTKTPKNIEYDVIAQITHRIREASNEGTTGFVSLVEALHDNRKLWDIFAVEMVDKNNPLPPDLKARLSYLADFTRIHTGKVLANEEPVDPLIEVNTAIMRGLRSGAT
ncbi:MAG: flagellar biosynthesis regulator FlaF [Rhodobacteraceae bacterium]|nr:flagellar biosynthesis regulator FlaF [Paracoccaceae bacterium]